jgi:predicted GIY-YIG superfamily endonuclease
MADHPRKQVRKWKRAGKLRLIEERNPDWIPACAGMTAEPCGI